MSSVAVIMRTKNSADILAQTLKALFSQDFQEFTLHIIDSGSTDKTIEIALQYPCTLTQIEADEYIPGPILNRAIEPIDQEILVFVNSDTVPLNPQTLGTLVAAFKKQDVAAAYVRQVPRPDAEPWVERDYQAAFPRSAAPPWLPLSLAMAAIKRTHWEEHPFYSAAWGSEDIEWGVWAKQKGLQVAYLPDAIAMHSHNYTLRQLYGRRFIEGEADAFIYQKSYSILKCLFDALKGAIRDIPYYTNKKQFFKIPLIPIRRAIGKWAYYLGHKHGTHRRLNGDPNTKTGQETVLSRYE